MSANPTDTSAASDLAGSTGFADVLGSILGQRSGTPEQYATLVALVARDLGVPARVATGFRVVPDSGDALLAPGSYDVTGADAWSWVEIPIIGSGWVVLDAAPGRFSPNNPLTESAAPKPSPSSAPPTRDALLTQGNNGHAVAPQSTVPDTAVSADRGVIIAVVVAIALLLLGLLMILLGRKPARARRRRRSPDPRTRLIGAWQESLDVLTEAGLPELTTLTSAEIATLTSEQFGAQSGAEAAALGTAANAVAYSRATVVAPDEADAAWERHRVLRSSVRRQLGWQGRIAAGWRYHRPRRATRPVSPESWAGPKSDSTPDGAPRSRGERPESAGARRRGYRGRRRSH